MELNSNQVLTLRLINSLVSGLFLANLAFIIHNLYRYVYGLKIYRSLVVVFYVLIFISTSFRIVEAVYRAIDPQRAFFGTKQYIYSLSQEIALVAIVCIGLLLVVTMYQLILSL